MTNRPDDSELSEKLRNPSVTGALTWITRTLLVPEVGPLTRSVSAAGTSFQI